MTASNKATSREVQPVFYLNLVPLPDKNPETTMVTGFSLFWERYKWAFGHILDTNCFTFRNKGNYSTFEYDGRGNQIKQITKEQDYEDEDEYHDITTTFEYDLMGNMVGLVQTPTYEYNLVRSMTQTNEYNALGQRVSKSEVTVQKDMDHPDNEDYGTTLPAENARYYYSGSALLFSTHWGGDKSIIYNPLGNHHGGIPYYKYSSGSTGITRYDVFGNPIQ